MKKRSLNATGLRFGLTLSLFVIALLSTAVLYFAYDRLHDTAIDVSHAVVDASASQNNIQTLKVVQEELANEQDVIARAGNIVADSQSYQYQNQIINDLNGYAAKAGLSIISIDFAADTPTGTTAAPTAKSPAAVTPSGLKATTVSITLQNPVPYNNMLRFIHAIEQNLTKMQISRVGLAKGSTGNDVTSEALTIQVYIK
jgi:hypothetical protein